MPKGVFAYLYEVQCQKCQVHFQSKRPFTKWCVTCDVLVDKASRQAAGIRHQKPCPGCGMAIWATSARCRSCDGKLRGKQHRGQNNYRWKGGRVHDARGYIQVLAFPDALEGHKYRAEHILVWEAANGPLPKGHIVHHRNHIKDDNRLENLEAMLRSEHNHRHGDRTIKELRVENEQLRARVAMLEEMLNAPSR